MTTNKIAQASDGVLETLNALSIFFFIAAVLSLGGAAVTDEWPGANPFGVALFFFLAAFLFIVCRVLASVKRTAPSLRSTAGAQHSR